MVLPSGRREQLLAAAAYAATGAIVGAWLAWHANVPLPVLVSLAAALGGWLGLHMLRPMRGRLRWDGERWWHLPGAGTEHPLHSLDLMMDLGGWLLLRARLREGRRWPMRGHWCGISSHDVGSAWHGLRVALYQGPVRMQRPQAPQARRAVRAAQ
ncbi:MAG TPA: hypothetical protein VD932_04410 [Aquabacterium sp.]|nr:hypothetical protein [Aquabacterium sp.]